jgi:hypothetical protein
MQSERATGTLQLQHNGDSASLYFLFGHLFHASGGRGQGEDVVVDALGWPDGDYQFDPRAKLPAEETIKSSPAELIATAESRSGDAGGSSQAEPAAAGAGATTSAGAEPSPWGGGDFSVVEPRGSSPADLTYTPPAPSPVTAQPAASTPAAPDSALASWAATQSDVAVPAASEAPAETRDSGSGWTERSSGTAAAPAPAPASQTPAPSSGARPSSPPQPLGAPGTERNDVMYPFPAGRAHYEGLKSAFVDFPRLLRTLRSDRHTGYVRLSGSNYLSVILLHEGQALEAVNSNGTVTKGDAAFQQIRRHMDSGDGVLDVIELDRDIVMAVARLFSAPHIYTGLLGRFVNLDALLEYLGEEKVDGSVLVTANEIGVILLGGGEVLGAYTESKRQLEKSTAVVASLAGDRSSRIEVKGGNGAVTPLDVEAALNRPA